MRMQETIGQAIKIAVVGDVHDAWEMADHEALHHLGIDLVLLVGDFGNESVEVVRTIAALDLPKAAILGNHDAWYSASDWGKSRCPYDRHLEDRVQQQLDLLGVHHVGYGKLELPQFDVTVVGSRPFSWGGETWKNAEFYQQRYGINSFQDSIELILQVVQAAESENIIFMGHNGPLGLGDRPEDPCGKDWPPLGGDYGDGDFATAIAQSRTLGKKIPLVVFGHMHHSLRHRKDQPRKALVTSPEGTVYLNAANVPRIIQREGERLRNFSIVHLENQQVTKASLIWLHQDFRIASEQVLYQPKIPLFQKD